MNNKPYLEELQLTEQNEDGIICAYTDKQLPNGNQCNHMCLHCSINQEQLKLLHELYHPSRYYNPDYGDDRICECGHAYYRHFDSYEDMHPCGCKYCGCNDFVEKLK